MVQASAVSYHKTVKHLIPRTESVFGTTNKQDGLIKTFAPCGFPPGAAGREIYFGRTGRLSALPGSGATTGTTNAANRAARSAAKRRRAGKSSFPKSAGLAVSLALAVSLPLLAQHVRVYQEGNAWVEETTGTLPVAHDLRINTDVGSIDVRGKARGVMYVIRKRAAVPTRQEAEREFQRMKVSALKTGDQVVVDGRLLQGDVTRFTADISLQVPYDLKRVFINTGGGAMKLSSLAAAVTGKTACRRGQARRYSRPCFGYHGWRRCCGRKPGLGSHHQEWRRNVHIDSITGRAKIGTGGGRFMSARRTLCLSTTRRAILMYDAASATFRRDRWRQRQRRPGGRIGSYRCRSRQCSCSRGRRTGAGNHRRRQRGAVQSSEGCEG